MLTEMKMLRVIFFLLLRRQDNDCYLLIYMLYVYRSHHRRHHLRYWSHNWFLRWPQENNITVLGVFMCVCVATATSKKTTLPTKRILSVSTFCTLAIKVVHIWGSALTSALWHFILTNHEAQPTLIRIQCSFSLSLSVYTSTIRIS